MSPPHRRSLPKFTPPTSGSIRPTPSRAMPPPTTTTAASGTTLSLGSTSSRPQGPVTVTFAAHQPAPPIFTAAAASAPNLTEVFQSFLTAQVVFFSSIHNALSSFRDRPPPPLLVASSLSASGVSLVAPNVGLRGLGLLTLSSTTGASTTSPAPSLQSAPTTSTPTKAPRRRTLSPQPPAPSRPSTSKSSRKKKRSHSRGSPPSSPKRRVIEGICSQEITCTAPHSHSTAKIS